MLLFRRDLVPFLSLSLSEAGVESVVWPSGCRVVGFGKATRRWQLNEVLFFILFERGHPQWPAVCALLGGGVRRERV
jgi:hypothetical protein